MNKEKDIHKELEELSPLLAKMKSQKESIEMPENYFHYLENSVMQQVELENVPVLQKTETASIPFLHRLFLSRTVAGLASVILLIIAGIYLNTNRVEASEPSQFADLTDTEILNYLADNAEILDIYSLDDLSTDASILDMVDLNEEDVDYLLEESFTDIFNEEIF